jgi:hypothetical protein
MLSCSKEHDDMEHELAEERRKKNQREPRRDSRSTERPAEPINPPLIIHGPEAVRDGYC